uniref:Gasdermin Eb n=1 Tax=Oryzias sinensis TaxID=183150 RepID=A0A8C7X4Q9_9TELE
MFALATKNFVDEVDKKGLLIPVSSLNHDIHLLTVVVKHNQFWFWKKPNYVPTDFTLNDVLTGDNPIKAVTETNFLKYSGTFSDTTQASVNAELSNAGVRSVTGKGSSTLKSSFGDLKKEEVELQKLLDDLKDRALDMSHVLIRQTMKKHKTVLGIVKERILTTTLSSVVEEEERSGQCAGSLSFFGSLSKKLDSLEDHFHLLTALPASKRSSLLQEISELMQSPLAISTLQNAVRGKIRNVNYYTVTLACKRASYVHQLDQMHVDQKPDLSESGLAESHQKNIKAVLDLLGKCDEAVSVLSAFHLITSALEGEKCSAALELEANIYKETKHLFESMNVSLTNDDDVLCAKVTPHSGNLPLILCISIRGLASLDTEANPHFTE